MEMTKGQSSGDRPRRLGRPLIVWSGLPFVALAGLAFWAGGCGQGSDNSGSDGSGKLKVAYLGLTCEGPIFMAYEKGFFKEEGLDVELVRTDWTGLREGLGTGQYAANHTLIMYLLKPLESGLDIKITGGIHTGCLRVQAGIKTNIKKVTDLRGKKIGVPTHLGSPPHLFASRVLAAHGIDPRPKAKEVEWVAIKPDVMGLAVDKGQVDAVATSDPIGTILLGKKLVRTIADQAVDKPYCDEFCCVAVVSGKIARESPETAAKLTRALLKGAKWVGENPTAAAKLGVEKKYIAASPEINAQAISKLKYLPGVSKCRKDILAAAKEMKTAGLLKPSTDPERLAKRAFLDLEGVTDQWVENLKVEKVIGGGRVRLLPPTEFVVLFESNKDCTCCCKCCIDR
jgi:NitT/TauT family transport system substrate-binding protein